MSEDFDYGDVYIETNYVDDLRSDRDKAVGFLKRALAELPRGKLWDEVDEFVAAMERQ